MNSIRFAQAYRFYYFYFFTDKKVKVICDAHKRNEA